MIIYFSKTQKDLVQAFPIPDDAENWVSHEVEDGSDYSQLEVVEHDGVWTVQPKVAIEQESTAVNLEQLKISLMHSIDNMASDIASYWTRFSDEYYEREEAAKAFAKANFEGEPSIWITGFAQPAGLDNKTATQLILKQAEQLRNMQAKLGALRMRKYELKRPSLNAEQLQAIHDDIIEAMNKLANAQF